MESSRHRKIRCGVLGAGWWATYAHIPALLEHPSAELVAIQKRNREEARKVAGDFGIPYAFTSADELLGVDGLEAVVVATSPQMHYAQAAAALRCGVHVLVEKPMTTTVQQARDLIRLADEHRVQLLISCPWHYTRHAETARRLILDGALGEIRMIAILMTNPIDALIRGVNLSPTHNGEQPYLEPRPGTYSDPEIAGGGQVYTQVSHVAAYLTYLTGAQPKEVFARFHNDGSRLDIYDVLNIELESGCLVSIASTGATSRNRRDHEVRVFGTKAILFLELWQGSMKMVRLGGGEAMDFPPLSDGEAYPERAPAMNLIDSALDAAANRSPGMLGLAAMEVIGAACRSASSGENIRIRQRP